MTQDQVAARMGVSVARMSQIEAGDVAVPRMAATAAIASGCNDCCSNAVTRR
jgi:transcriptional regulator with XRE-family HTH domain